MRPVLLHLIFCLTILKPIGGSRLGRLEDDVKILKSYIYRELSSIRDEVKEISNRVDILENITVTHDPGSPNQDMDITSYNLADKTGESEKQLLRAGNNIGSQAVKAEVQNIRKAYSNDKQNLHKLKNDVEGQLKELEQKITSHMHNLTLEVQHNIEYIHKNISLANCNLSEFINGSTTNVSTFSQNIKMEINELFANTSQQLFLQLNLTEAKIKLNISSTYSQNEDQLDSFLALAERNVNEMMLKADTIINLIRSNFSKIPIQITDLSMELQSIKNEMKGVEERLGNEFESSSSVLEKEIVLLRTCINTKGIIQNGFYYPCEKDIRLANASPYRSTGVQGRLEVRHDNEWGTACDDSYEKQPDVGTHYVTDNVNVVCRTFGFRECIYVDKAGLGQGSGNIWMDNMRCRGGESSFIKCPFNGWGVHNCGHHEDVGFRMWN
ncbi:myosin-11-like [Mya arenaria]|nr:myosin-11-like [Mya arenaria]